MNQFLPQLIHLCLVIFWLSKNIILDGQPKEPENYSARRTLIAFAIVFAILYWGGFYDGLIAKLLN